MLERRSGDLAQDKGRPEMRHILYLLFLGLFVPCVARVLVVCLPEVKPVPRWEPSSTRPISTTWNAWTADTASASILSNPLFPLPTTPKPALCGLLYAPLEA